MARKGRKRNLKVATVTADADVVSEDNSTLETQSDLPYAEDLEVKRAKDNGFDILNVERDGSYLFIEIEAPTFEDAIGADCRRLAYNIRYHYGFDKAGIEPYGGPVACNGRYRQTWKLTRSLV